MSEQTVVFDLDGTLIDTAPDLILATNHTLERAGFQPVAANFIRPFISYGTRRMLHEGINSQGRSVTEAQLDRLFVQLIEFYSQNMTIDSKPFPGIVDVLEKLTERGTKIAICTNKLERMASLLMEELGLNQYFEAITGRDTFAVCKPNPKHLIGAIALAGGAPSSAVLVGDSTTDYETAKAAGVPIIGVTFGYTDVPMVDLSCEAVISDYKDFFAALDRISSPQ